MHNNTENTPPTANTNELEIAYLFERIYTEYKYDFRDYSVASMNRRIHQALQGMSLRTIAELQECIRVDPRCFNDLLQFLTIPVSEMFRDPSYYKSIRETVVPVLRTYPSLKIWIAGCSTGEEVYSFAILLKEEGLLDRTIIYATDINEISLKKAQSGIFSIKDMPKFTENYQKAGGKNEFSSYYTTDSDSALFDSSLRKNITFNDHSLATDQVFSEVQFVSCRNVLIYFQRKLQERAIGLFQDSLCRKGFLGLGPKESVMFTKYKNDFKPIVMKDRIYQKIEDT